MEKRKILHYRLDGFKEVYLCNQAVKITEDKIAKTWRKVTCKNCLKHRRKK